MELSEGRAAQQRLDCGAVRPEKQKVPAGLRGVPNPRNVTMDGVHGKTGTTGRRVGYLPSGLEGATAGVPVMAMVFIAKPVALPFLM